MSVQAPDALLRRFEKETLDIYHRSLPIWKRPSGQSLYATLAAFDARTPPFFGEATSEAARHRDAVRFKDVEEGLSYAVRWLHDGSPFLAVEPTDDGEVLAEADGFLDHATDYNALADHHVRYSRKLIDIDVDPDTRTVRFRARPDLPFDLSLLGMIENVEDSQRRVNRASRANRAVAAEAIMLIRGIGHHLERGRLVIDDIAALNRDEVISYILPLLSEAELTIPTGSDLGGFTMGEFRTFWNALVRWSFACFFLALDSARQGRGASFVPTQVVSQEVFKNKIGLLSGLTPQTVESIVDRLRYDGSLAKPDVFLTPLFCAGGYVAWSPTVIIKSKSERNLLKQMARSKVLKKIADNLIGERERSLSNGFGQLLSRHGYAYKLMTELTHDDEDGELDLLAYHPGAPEEILLVEAKAVLAADEIGEGEAATFELIRAQGQLRRAADILNRMSFQQKSRLFKFVRWECVRTFYGLVLTPDTHPNERYDHSQIPGHFIGCDL